MSFSFNFINNKLRTRDFPFCFFSCSQPFFLSLATATFVQTYSLLIYKTAMVKVLENYFNFKPHFLCTNYKKIK